MIVIKKFKLKKNNLKDLKKFSDWPMVYLLSDNKKVYIGESYRLPQRMKEHLENENRFFLKNGLAIYDEMANKSSTLHIEGKLIEYLSAEGNLNILNGNEGEKSHSFYQKDLYESKLEIIWQDLIDRNFVKKELLEIENTDLFKYSPYKKLTDDQFDIARSISSFILNYYSNEIDPSCPSTFLIDGEAGTGKSILGIYLLKFIRDKIIEHKLGDLRIGYVVPMSSFRATMKQVAKNIEGLQAGMIIGPSDVVKKEYDILIVDEAHRLRHNVALMPGHIHAYKNINKKHFNNYDYNELDWILLKSKFQIMFYDPTQSVRPSDVPKRYFDHLKNNEDTVRYKLQSQLRVQGGENYIQSIKNKLFNIPQKNILNLSNYEFILYDNIDDMANEIYKKNTTYGLSRIVAGYAWPWLTKNIKSSVKANKQCHDIEIQGNYFRWNSRVIGWVLSDDAIDEVGSIHTIQGYDLNYCGVIIGPDLKYDEKNKIIVTDRNAYKDSKGKQQTTDIELDAYIRNIYSVLLTRAIKGTYVYVVDKPLKKHLKEWMETNGRIN